jgi:hypothetical protein
MKKVPPELDKIIDIVLAYRPKKKIKNDPKKTAGKKRKSGCSQRGPN